MRAGVSTACLYPELLEKAFAQLAENGVGLAEIFVNSDCELHDPYLAEMLAVQREYGVKVSSVHPYTCGIEPMMLFTEYERRVDDMLDYYKRFFGYMNQFGAKYFILHGNKPQNKCPDERYFERYARLQDTASQFGVTVVQENVARCTGRSLDFLVKMADTLGDTAKFVLDVKQARRSDIDPVDAVKALGRHIVHVHYSDCGEKGDCLKFGDGSFDNRTFFDALRDVGYNGCVVIELYRGSYANAADIADNYRSLDRFLSENGY